MLNISVLVSGGGTNLQAVIDAVESGQIQNARIVQVISSNSRAFSLNRAQKHGIAARVIGKENFPDPAQRTAALIHALSEKDTDLVVLAGYMSVLDPEFIAAYRNRIINIHPSLIPKFCGKGFYGKRVHQAVLDAKEKVSGATVHYVDEGVDTGPVILQKQVPVDPVDTVDSLAERVLTVEHEILVKAIGQLAEKMNQEKEKGVQAER